MRSYIAGLPGVFGNFLAAETFEEYVANMRREDVAWGDNLTLVAMAHILGRPIRVIRSVEQNWDITIPPANDIAESDWPAPIVLAHLGERHYEATEPM